MNGFINWFFYLFDSFIFVYVIVVDSIYLLLFVLSIRALMNYRKGISLKEYDEISTSQLTPPVTIIVPAYNEEVTIEKSTLSFLNMNYPEYEVIVVNDGSKDTTLEKLIAYYNMVAVDQAVRQQLPCQQIKGIYRSVDYPLLMVIDKENGGKADALNAGINFSQYPYYCGVDADSILEQDALLKSIRPFIEGADNVIACGGIVRIANGCTIRDGRVLGIGLPQKAIGIFQVIEYLRSFLMGRLGFSSLNNLLIISGAFGIFRKQDVIAVGGYNTATVGEDMELVVRLQKYLYETNTKAKVLFVPDPVCWTEVPEDISVLYRQRTRWQIGLLECLLLHRKTIFNPKYKIMGLLAMPYFLIVELLGPTIELIGFIFLIIGLYLGVVNLSFAVFFLIATIVFGMFLSISAVLLEEFSFRRYPRVSDLLKLALYSVLENFWYRQINAVWRTWAFIRFLRNDKAWGKMTRQGVSQ